MNNPNPFLPNGVFLDQKNKARTRLKIAVLSSISLSVMVLTVLLIQGCKKPADTVDNTGIGTTNDSLGSATQLSSTLPDITASSPIPSLTNPAPALSNATTVVSAPPPVVTPPPPPVAEAQEYTIVAHDTYSVIATKNNTTVKAIMNANPGVDPKKLKVGQKIKLPAAAAPSATTAPTSAPTVADIGASSGAVTYKVKSGDTLTTIAKKYHGVTVKAIQQANNLTTTAIKVGQVLKIPATAAPAPAPEAAPVPAPAPAPAPTMTPAPMSNGTAVPMH